MRISSFFLRLYAALAAIVVAVLGRRDKTPFIRARKRGLPFVHSTIRVARGVWRNWSGELVSRPGRLYCDDAGGPWRSPRTLDDLQAIVWDAQAEGATVRVFGSSHSWAALVPTDGYIVDNRFLNSTGDRFNLRLDPPSADGTRKARVTVPPGLLSSELEHWLWEMGYSLPASALEDCFTVGGMISTATHGVGLDIPTLSDMVLATSREIPAGTRPRGALRRFLHLSLADLCSMVFSSILFKTLRRLPRWASLIAWLSGSTNLWVALRSGPVGGTAAYLREQYEAAGSWQRFLGVREAVDPDGVFLNDYLRSWFYPRRVRTSQPLKAAA